MGLRTPQQYIESLQDDRAVYYRGEKVADVTKHPVIKKAVHHAGARLRNGGERPLPGPCRGHR